MTVEPGYYLVRLVPYGPLVPARIYWTGERDDSGNLVSDSALCAEIAGRPAPLHDCYLRHRIWTNDEEQTELVDCPGCPACDTQAGGDFPVTMAAHAWKPGNILKRGIYPKCLRHPISEQEYRFLIDDTKWVNQYEPTDPANAPYLTTKRFRETLAQRKALFQKVTE